jgi:hypothetical protein
MSDSGIAVNTPPWGFFLERLKGAGVEVATMKGSPYLRREVEENLL